MTKTLKIKFDKIANRALISAEKFQRIEGYLKLEFTEEKDRNIVKIDKIL